MTCTLSRVCIVLDYLRVIRIPHLVNLTSDLVRCLVVSNCAYECGATFEIRRKPKNATRKIVLNVKGDTRSSHACMSYCKTGRERMLRFTRDSGRLIFRDLIKNLMRGCSKR